VRIATDDDDEVARPRITAERACAPVSDGPQARPDPALRLDAEDHGVVLRHGDGPGGCDALGARDVVTWRIDDTWYMNYDGAGATGWLCCFAISKDGEHWTKAGPVLELGAPGAPDAGSASYGVPVVAPDGWHLFYLGAAKTSAPPERIPAVPYVTLKARGPGPGGPWTKQPEVVPFAPAPGTFYADTASPGMVFNYNGAYYQAFSAASGDPLQRGLGLAHTTDLNGPWTVEPAPLLPLTEQIENSAVFHEAANDTWFLFTNHVQLAGQEFNDSIWVYWSKDPTKWDPANKAVVLDGHNCCWSRRVIGLPSIVPLEDRIALFYDGSSAPGTPMMGRDVGLAYLPRPLAPPAD
jgi:predicted GH43/DUF377 family glycosyl hydrolase